MDDAFNLPETERQLRAAADAAGVDLDALLRDASRHFTSDTIVPSRASESDVAQIVADELAFDAEEEAAAQRELDRVGLSNAELIRFAKRRPPPREWIAGPSQFADSVDES